MFKSKEILKELVELNSSIKTLTGLLRHFPDIPNVIGRPKKPPKKTRMHKIHNKTKKKTV